MIARKVHALNHSFHASPRSPRSLYENKKMILWTIYRRKGTIVDRKFQSRIETKKNFRNQALGFLWYYHLTELLWWKFYIIRGYYMAARRYEISLRVLKNILREREANERNIFQREEQFRTKPYHFNIQFWYVATATWSIRREFVEKVWTGAKKRNQEGGEEGRDGNLLLPLRSSIFYALALTSAP